LVENQGCKKPVPALPHLAVNNSAYLLSNTNIFEVSINRQTIDDAFIF